MTLQELKELHAIGRRDIAPFTRGWTEGIKPVYEPNMELTHLHYYKSKDAMIDCANRECVHPFELTKKYLKTRKNWI